MAFPKADRQFDFEKPLKQLARTEAYRVNNAICGD
jgi:hypothetical protein